MFLYTYTHLTTVIVIVVVIVIRTCISFEVGVLSKIESLLRLMHGRLCEVGARDWNDEYLACLFRKFCCCDSSFLPEFRVFSEQVRWLETPHKKPSKA